MARTKHGTRTKHLLGGCSLAAAVALAGLPALTSAETIQVPVGQQAKQKQTMDRPISGMKRSAVEELFGKPVEWLGAVGDPPISSWIYPDFVVYFEYDQVIHTVLRHESQPVASRSEPED